MNKNYQEYKNQILDNILKSKSTSALSRRMGFSFDKVKRWKNGSKQLRWNEFCDLCIAVKAPLWEALATSLGMIFQKKKDAYHIVEHLKVYSQKKRSSEIAKKMNISVASFQRYLNEEIYPDVEFILEMIDLRPGFLENFISQFSNEKNSDSKSILSISWSIAVANAASLKAHMDLPEHSSKWIADFLNISIPQVEEALAHLVSIGLIEKRGPHYSPTLSRTLAINRENDNLSYSRFIRYWMKRADLRFQTENGNPINVCNGPNKDGFRIFSSSKESANKITEVLLRAEQEIHDLLTQDKGEKTDVRVLLFHHFSTQDFIKK